MHDFFTAALLIADAAVVAVAAWALLRCLNPGEYGPLETGVAWGLVFITLVAGAGVLLGAIGGLGLAGFFTTHAAILAVLGWGRRAHWPQDRAAFADMLAAWRRIFAARDATSGTVTILLALLLLSAVLAAFAQPVVYDALTYRLPRIGQWLQDGRIGVVAADEPRINYMPVVPDLVMAWLVSAAPAGFNLSAVAQTMGGALVVGATIGLARQTGLGRPAALGAGLLLFGMANVVPQFTSVQTDLFTTGVFAAAFYLWLAALRRGEGSILGGLGAGLALGSKGTLFYLAPGAVLWVGWLAWRHPLRWTHWNRTILAAVVSGAIFLGPVFVRNWRTYGGPLGPAAHVQMHHGRVETRAEELEKLQLNLRSSLAQVFEPNSQPGWGQKAARAVGEILAQHLPEHDRYTLEGINRRSTLLEIMARSSPDADATSFGVLTLALFFLGALAAVFARRREGAGLVAAWSAGSMVFLLFFHAMQQWHPFGFRYFVLVAPWMAVVGAWWLEGLPRPARLAGWGIAVLAGAGVFWTVTLQTHQSGWQAISRPEHSRGYYVFGRWREWAADLDEVDRPLAVALPDRRPLAAFYRLPSARRITLRHQPDTTVDSAEKFIGEGNGWVILPAAQFMGREGRVLARTWLFQGEENSPFSLAAYRHLRLGEKPAPILYRTQHTNRSGQLTVDLLVRSWTDVAPLRLHNPSGSDWQFAVSTAGDRHEGVLRTGETRDVVMKLSAGNVSQVLVEFVSRGSLTEGAGPPTVELVRGDGP